MMSQPHELTWGDLVLSSVEPSSSAWRIEALVPTDFGSPVPVIEAVESMLVDGDLSVINRWGNREFTVKVRISADTGADLAAAEAALMLEATMERPSPLLYTPPAFDSISAAFEVVTVKVERDYDDIWDVREKNRVERHFSLAFECLPWVRDVNLSTIPAIAAPADPGTPATYVTINTASSATGWSGVRAGTTFWSAPIVDSGSDGAGTYVRALANQQTGGTGVTYMGLRTPAPGSMGGFGYLTVDANLGPFPTGTNIARAYINGVATDPVAMVSINNSTTYFRYYFPAPATITSLDFVGVWLAGLKAVASRFVSIYEIGRTDRIEINGSSGLQVARIAQVGGSAPTQAAITLDAGANPLIGSTALIYTGASPAVPLRSLVTSSATVTPDTAMISGARNTLASATVARVPVSRLSNAQYSILARLNFTGTAAISWQARVVASDGTAIPGSDLVVTGTTQTVNSSADPWKIHTLTTISLPTIQIEGTTSHAVEISLSMTTGGSGVQIDEAWLLDTENGAVTLLHEPSAFQLTKVELRSPQIDSPRPAVIGTWSGYGTQDITRLTVPGTHLLRPGMLHVFTATDLAKYAACDLTFYRRHGWHPTRDEEA